MAVMEGLILRLDTEIASIKTRLSRLESTHPDQHTFRVGDRVQLSIKRVKKIGIVRKITTKQLHIRVPGLKGVHRRLPSNVSLLPITYS